MVAENQLSGTIPPELALLSNLEDLNIGKKIWHYFQIFVSNYCRGDNLTHSFFLITTFSASNTLTGEIPSQFGDLRFLKFLDLRE